MEVVGEGPGFKMVAFEEMDEFFAYMEDQRKAGIKALENLTDAQREIDFGDCVYYEVDGIEIWGYIPTLRESLITELYFASDREVADREVSEEHTYNDHADMLESGRRFGIWFSAGSMGVDLGSVHLTMMSHKVSVEELMEKAREFGVLDQLRKYAGPLGAERFVSTDEEEGE